MGAEAPGSRSFIYLVSGESSLAKHTMEEKCKGNVHTQRSHFWDEFYIKQPVLIRNNLFHKACSHHFWDQCLWWSNYLPPSPLPTTSEHCHRGPSFPHTNPRGTQSNRAWCFVWLCPQVTQGHPHSSQHIHSYKGAQSSHGWAGMAMLCRVWVRLLQSFKDLNHNRKQFVMATKSPQGLSTLFLASSPSALTPSSTSIPSIYPYIYPYISDTHIRVFSYSYILFGLYHQCRVKFS